MRYFSHLKKSVFTQLAIVHFLIKSILSIFQMQVKVESAIERLLENFVENVELDSNLPRLNRVQIVDFVKHGLSRLASSYQVPYL